ncbi:hypothetical protein [Nostoc sp.]
MRFDLIFNYPYLLTEEQPLSFDDWYEDWLNRSLHQIRQSSET